MNKTIYSLITLFFISSFGLMGQSKKKYQKTFSVDKNTKLKFETHNIDVTFKTWNKNQVKVDFNVNFKNYSDEEINAISNGIVIAATMQSTMRESNYLHIRNASPTSIGKLSYRILEGEIRIENMFFQKEKENRYKTVTAINKEISENYKGFYDLDGYVLFKDDSLALKNIKNTTRKEVQSIRSTYEIYVPKYMMLDLLVNNANVYFEGDITNQIKGSFEESLLEASELHNKNNMISFMSGSVKIKKIVGGNYMLKNVSNGLIGQLENVTLQTEFSKLDIGEITKNVQIKDFKGDFFIYNVADNFERIEMLCEYSDIKMYTIKDQKYYMEAIGNNAVLNDNGTKIIMQPNKNGDKHKMFTRGKDNPETRKNTFKLDLIHGFVTLFYNK